MSDKHSLTLADLLADSGSDSDTDIDHDQHGNTIKHHSIQQHTPLTISNSGSDSDDDSNSDVNEHDVVALNQSTGSKHNAVSVPLCEVLNEHSSISSESSIDVNGTQRIINALDDSSSDGNAAELALERVDSNNITAYNDSELLHTVDTNSIHQNTANVIDQQFTQIQALCNELTLIDSDAVDADEVNDSQSGSISGNETDEVKHADPSQLLHDVLSDSDTSIDNNNHTVIDGNTDTRTAGQAKLFEPCLNAALIADNVPAPPTHNTAMYVRWICQYRPKDMLEYTRTHMDTIDIVHVQQLCTEYNIYDTLSFLYEQRGQIDQALAVLLTTYNESIQAILHAVQYYPPTDYSTVQHNVKYSVNLCSALCIRERDDFQLYCAVLDTLFDSYTKSNTMHTILRTLIGDCITEYINSIGTCVDSSELVEHLLNNHITDLTLYTDFKHILYKLLSMCSSELNLLRAALQQIKADIVNNHNTKYKLLSTPRIVSTGICGRCGHSLHHPHPQPITAYVQCRHVLHQQCSNTIDNSACTVCFPTQSLLPILTPSSTTTIQVKYMCDQLKRLRTDIQQHNTSFNKLNQSIVSSHNGNRTQNLQQNRNHVQQNDAPVPTSTKHHSSNDRSTSIVDSPGSSRYAMLTTQKLRKLVYST